MKRYSKEGLSHAIETRINEIEGLTRDDTVSQMKELLYQEKVMTGIKDALKNKLYLTTYEIFNSQTDMDIMVFEKKGNKKYNKTMLFMLTKWLFKQVKRITPFEQSITRNVTAKFK